MLVIAFYSIGTSYEDEALLLGSSLSSAGMDYRLQGFHDRGGWFANTAFKAEYIRDTRNDFPGPLLYVDADAFVHENCDKFFVGLAVEGYDFGAHWFAGPAGGHNHRNVCPCVRGEPCDREHRLLSGTLFFGDTAGARRLLEAWCALNATMRERGLVQGGGQKNLWYLTTCMKDLKVARLPGRYCYVFDKKWAYPGDEPRIIEHTIGSRDHRPHDNGKPKTTKDRARAQRIHELKRLVSA